MLCNHHRQTPISNRHKRRNDWPCQVSYKLTMPNDPKLSHGANNRKREFAAKCKMKEQSPLAPARC
jgi:hypothetical protein